jgi:hypothetical protein
MTLPTELQTAFEQRRLLLLWGASLFPPPGQPGPAQWAAWQAGQISLPAAAALLPQLPPLPILSLDPGDRLERAFDAANVPLRVLHNGRDVPVAGRHNLFKMAGDIERRTAITHPNQIRDLLNERGRRYLLNECKGVVAEGALLLLGSRPDATGFAEWWRLLYPALGRPPACALDAGQAAWPVGITPLALPVDALLTELPEPAPAAPAGESSHRVVELYRRRLAILKEQQSYFGPYTPPHVTMEIQDIEAGLDHLPETPAAPGSGSSGGKYTLNISGPVSGLTVGDHNRVVQQFPAGPPTPELAAALAALEARIAVLSTQLAAALAELQRGQRAIYQRLRAGQRESVDQVLTGLRAGQLACRRAAGDAE